VDSKKPIYFGEFQIKGNQRYPQSVISGMAQFKTGDVYDLDKLLDYQQALENDSHYTGASVQADFDNLQGDRVPVKVAVSEAKRQKFETGISFDSEYGLGGELGYEHYNIFNRGYVGSFAWEMDKYQTKLGIGISQPRKGSGYFNTANLAYNRSTTQNLEKRGITSGFWRVRDRDGIESRVGIEFIAEDSRIPNSNVNFGRSYATMLTASWKRQRLETLLRPANGYYLSGKIGATLGSLLSSAPMIRVHGSAGYYYTPENKKLGTWVARGEIGYVHTNQKFEDGNVPSSLMFRSGGASSIRGYELNSIGRKIPPSSAVLPERAMFVASAEYQYPIKGSFALAAFHDVGSVAHRFKDMTLYHGTGIGVRWFSPAAPFSFDIAYGHRDKKLRWHISLGTRF
jgi:surface antigen